MQEMFARMSDEKSSFDCGAMMQKMCCGTSEEQEN